MFVQTPAPHTSVLKHSLTSIQVTSSLIITSSKLARRALEPRHLLFPKLTRFSTGTLRRLKSRNSFVPAAQNLLKTSNDFNISAADWLDHAWNKEWKDNITRLHTYITGVSPVPLGIKQPRSAWARLNRLWTGVKRFRSNIYKWRLAPSAACKCREEQTADHVINNCRIYNPLNEECSLMILDEKTTFWFNQSINQGFVFFVRYTADNHIKMHTCGRKKKESATKRYTLKHAPIQGYKSNSLKMHGRWLFTICPNI